MKKIKRLIWIKFIIPLVLVVFIIMTFLVYQLSWCETLLETCNRFVSSSQCTRCDKFDNISRNIVNNGISLFMLLIPSIRLIIDIIIWVRSYKSKCNNRYYVWTIISIIITAIAFVAAVTDDSERLATFFMMLNFWFVLFLISLCSSIRCLKKL